MQMERLRQVYTSQQPTLSERILVLVLCNAQRNVELLQMGASRLRRDCLRQRGMPGWVHP